MDLPTLGHESVMLDQVLRHLNPQPGQTFVDCTLGRAGHALAIAQQLGPAGLLIGIDADPRNLQFAADRLKQSACPSRVFHANFAELPEVLRQSARPQVHGILVDLGISTNQLFDPAYGMSFDRAMPLDMRIDPRLPQSAADLVNKLPENDLANVLYELAQERHSRKIARKIGEARRISPIQSTEALADLVRRAIGSGSGQKIDPATRTFLALRMAVNREIENLAALLQTAPQALLAGGHLAVLSFQSMEDRAVKLAFRSLAQTGRMKIITPKPELPTDAEIARNPRARSAKLRVAQRLA